MMTSEARALATREAGLRIEIVSDLEHFESRETEIEIYTFVSLLAAGLIDLPASKESYEKRHEDEAI